MLSENRTLRVSICDDEKIFCAEFEELLHHTAGRLNLKIQVDVWFSGETIQEYLTKGNHIDIIFLDIEMMRLSGIDLGNYVRETMRDYKTQIVYVSSNTNYAMKLFRSHPYDFLVKPIREEELYQVMEGLSVILSAQNRIFEYRNGRDSYQIQYDDILYFRSDLRKIAIVTMEEEIEFYGKLKTIIEQAPPQFLAIHKSYLVNRDYVEKYALTFVEMKNKQILTISKAFQKSVRDRLCQKR